MGRKVEKIQHSAITVKDLEESVKFYQDFLGLEKIGEIDLSVDQEGFFKGIDVHIAFLKAGDDELELVEYKTPEAERKNDLKPWDTGAQHIAFKVTELQSLYTEYKDKIDFLSKPIDYKTEGMHTLWTYLRDPNGAIVEISEDLIDRFYE